MSRISLSLFEWIDADVRQLLRSSVVYSFGTVFTKALSIFLLPLYTRWLTPADYGIVSIAATVTAVLGILLTLGLNSAITRIYYAARSEEERKAQSGTIAIAMITIAIALTLGFEFSGPVLTPMVFNGLAYDPYIRIAVWTTFLAGFSVLPPIFLQLKNQPGKFIALAAGNTALTIALTVWFVGIERRGAYGYLIANLYSALIIAIPSIWITLRNIRPMIRWPVLTSALAFGAPLVPHNLAAWVMDFSDRVILQRHVALPEIGLYSLGYQFGLVMLMAASSLNAAWIPFFYRKIADDADASKRGVSRVVTYYILTLCVIALAGTLLARDVIPLLVAPIFRPSIEYVPWVIAAYLCSGLYTIPGNFLNALGRSALMAVSTIAAALLNFALNVLLIPKYGALAACWSTLSAYGLMLVLYFLAGQRVYSFPYEYRRIGAVFGLISVGFVLGSLIDTSSTFANMALKIVLVAAIPLVFVAGELSPTERRRYFHRIVARVSVRTHK